MTLVIDYELEAKKTAFNDPEGNMNYVNPLQEIILNNIKLIDKHISSKKVGSRNTTNTEVI